MDEDGPPQLATRQAASMPLLAEVQLMTRDDYRAQAIECLQLVGQVRNETAKLGLINKARILLWLADQCEENGRTDLVYEMPSREPRSHGSPARLR